MATLTVQLAHHEVLALPAARGLRVRCLDGSAWITLDHDQRDVVLNGGEAFDIDRNGVTLLHALAPTRLCIDAGAANTRRPGALVQRLIERLWPRRDVSSPAAAAAGCA